MGEELRDNQVHSIEVSTKLVFSNPDVLVMVNMGSTVPKLNLVFVEAQEVNWTTTLAIETGVLHSLDGGQQTHNDE